MNKKAWFYCGSWLVVGLAIGYMAASASDGRAVSRAFATFRMTDLGEMEHRAFQAYQHESSLVGIYAQTEALDKLKDAKQYGLAPFMSAQMVSFDMMLTHARLAKLYAETGQTNLSAQHFADALTCAKETDNGQGITNESALMELVTKIDKAVK